ncbi:unnamed protein product [Clonostachys rhizophaga]|uniref:Uncharacterized protein n=1 Tax=Clonostachys rhizophaga TaxID=160324 RepID=A0A9N9W0Q8_9HYPO|nr:unnamed protein product [Clonostachys rhizophaga]
MLAFTSGVSLFTFQSSDSSTWLAILALFFVVGGYNATVTTTQVACITAVDRSQQAVMTSAISKHLLRRWNLMIITPSGMAKSIGSTLMLAIVSAAYQNTLR